MSEHTDDILALFLAQSLLDGDLRFTEREQLFLFLRTWKPDLERADFRLRLSAASAHIQAASSTAALMAVARQHASRLRPWIRPSRARSVQLVEQLCQLAQVDGELSQVEVLCVQQTIEALGLQERVRLDLTDGVASITARKSRRRAS